MSSITLAPAAPTPEGSDRTLIDFFEHVYRPLRLIQAAAGTIQQYRVAIAVFGRFLNRAATLDDLTEENVTSLMASILADGRSPVTANGRASCLKTLALLAKRKKYISEDLSAVDKLRCPRRLPTAWSNAEMERMVASCRQAEDRIAGVPANRWWPAFVLAAYDTGLRRRALLAIRFDEIDFERGLLRVPAENMKTAVEQCFQLHPQTIEAILASVPPDRERVFPMHYKHLRCFYVRFKTILKRAGLPFTGRDMVHKLRRTCASHIAAKAGEGLAIKQLGHLDPSCIKRYVDPTFTSNHDSSALLPRPAWDNPREVIVTKSEGTFYRLGDPLKVILPGEGLGHPSAIDRIMATNAMDVADVRQAIAELGLSVVEFAREAGLAAGHLSGVLNGERRLTASMERFIAVALGLSYAGLSRERRGPLTADCVAEFPPVGSRPDEHPLLDAEPMSLIVDFGAEALKGRVFEYRRRVLANLRTSIQIDGARCIRDMQPESTIAHIVRRQQLGAIGQKTAEGCCTSIRSFFRWLVEGRGVYWLARILPQLHRGKTRAVRSMGARLQKGGTP